MSIRVVVDTNVLVGAMLSAGGGNNREVLRRSLKGMAQPLIGAALFHEYEELLERPDLLDDGPLSEKERKSLVAAFLSVSEWIKIYYLWRPNLPDEADNHLIELALAGDARAIISNNIRDLHHGELQFPNLHILTPTEFLKTF